MEIPILVAIFQSIPECIALVFLTLVLLKVKLNWGIILILGILQTFATFSIRLLPFLEFGVHTVILLLVLTVLVMCVSKQKFLMVAPMALLSFAVMLVFEYIIFRIFIFMTGITIWELLEDQLLRIVLGAPQWILLFLVGFIIQHFRNKKIAKEAAS